jgi:GAF domain-containing protein
LGRLRRVLGDLRSGLLSATVSLNLMTIVADSVERAVLFVQQGEQLVALGAFGTTSAGKPLAGITRGLSLRLEAASALSRAIAEGHAFTLDYDDGELPAELGKILDRPRSGQGVFFPVLGARRSIGLIYADNGRRTASVQDVELMELATAQVGLAFENELLRRQLERLDRVVA